MTVRVVLAEDSYLVREGLQRLLDASPEIEVAAVCDDFDSLVAAIEEHNPAVVVTDIRMPPTHTDEGIRAAAHVREVAPGTGVVVLSQYADAEYALALLDTGSEGRAYLLKDRISDPDQIVRAVRKVAGGGSVIDPEVVDSLVTARSRGDASPLTRLTPRETEVLAEMAQGKSNAAIASTLVLSERAVEKHISSLLAKLDLPEEANVNRRVKAVLVYLADS